MSARVRSRRNPKTIAVVRSLPSMCTGSATTSNAHVHTGSRQSLAHCLGNDTELRGYLAQSKPDSYSGGSAPDPVNEVLVPRARSHMGRSPGALCSFEQRNSDSPIIWPAWVLLRKEGERINFYRLNDPLD